MNHLGGAARNHPTVHQDRDSVGNTKDRVYIVFHEEDPGLLSHRVQNRGES